MYSYNFVRKKMSNTQFTTVDSSTYIGVDIGGTNTRIGLFRSLDTPEFAHIARFPTYKRYEEQIHRIIDEVRTSKVQYIVGIGVSVAARIAKDGRSVTVAPNLSDYVDKPFAEDLVKALNSPVRLA